MSEFLDELARSLAKPMPRSRALRILGGAIAAAALPSVRAAPAFGGRRGVTRAVNCGDNPCSGALSVVCDCPSPVNPSLCFHTCGVPGCTCCCYPVNGGNTGANCCPPGYRCGKPGEASCVCVGGETCSKKDPACCHAGESCNFQTGKCEKNRCPQSGSRECGSDCCNDDTEYCADPARSLCCSKAPRKDACVAFDRISKQSAETCCTPGECCFDNGKPGAGKLKAACCPRERCCQGECCGPHQTCVGGVCTCPKGKKRCGKFCCEQTKGNEQECCPEKFCCPHGESCCGSQCCDPARQKDCCARKEGEICCLKTATCCGKECCDPATETCLRSPRSVQSRSVIAPSRAVCCPKNRVYGGNFCCPAPLVAVGDGCCPPGKPDCCEGVLPLARGAVCVNGISRKPAG